MNAARMTEADCFHGDSCQKDVKKKKTRQCEGIMNYQKHRNGTGHFSTFMNWNCFSRKAGKNDHKVATRSFFVLRDPLKLYLVQVKAQGDIRGWGCAGDKVRRRGLWGNTSVQVVLWRSTLSWARPRGCGGPAVWRVWRGSGPSCLCIPPPTDRWRWFWSPSPCRLPERGGESRHELRKGGDSVQ